MAVDDPDRGRQDFTPLVRRALQYWERKDTWYADREVEFVLRNDAGSPDVVVRVVPRTSPRAGRRGGRCRVRDAARRLELTEGAAVVCVASGYIGAATRWILEHEFGLRLGVDHGEVPAVMDSRRDDLRLPVPGPAVCAFSRDRHTIEVYVDFAGIYALRRYRAQRQIGRVLAYYGTGAGGTIDRDIAVRRVGDRSRADVVIEFPTTSPCGESNGGPVRHRRRDGGRHLLAPGHDRGHERPPRGDRVAGRVLAGRHVRDGEVGTSRAVPACR